MVQYSKRLALSTQPTQSQHRQTRINPALLAVLLHQPLAVRARAHLLCKVLVALVAQTQAVQVPPVLAQVQVVAVRCRAVRLVQVLPVASKYSQ